MQQKQIITKLSRDQIVKCDVCGSGLHKCDIVDSSNDIRHYPYEGLINTFLCPDCGHLTLYREDMVMI